jgi:hypothetical protein
MIGKANYCGHNRSSWHHGSAGLGTATGDCERYVLERGLGELRTGDRVWRGTYWRQGVVSYVLERQGVVSYVLERQLREVRT